MIQFINQTELQDVHFEPIVEKGLGCLSAMSLGAEQCSDGHLCFAHDDTFFLDKDWALILESFFLANPRCGLIGLGGAEKFGSPFIYKTRYQLIQLIRYDFWSNMKNWRTHGKLASDPKRVAFVDGFVMCFRREAYDQMGGWSRLQELGLPEFHAYDMMASIEMHRLGWEVWMLPIYCHHEGGKTSCTPEYDQLVKQQGFKNGQELFERAHKVCYEHGRGILPIWF